MADGQKSPTKPRQWLPDGRGCLGRKPMIFSKFGHSQGGRWLWMLVSWNHVDVPKVSKRTFFSLKNFMKSCGQRDGCSCTRIRYVLAILLLLFLVACLEVWTGNWSQFCMTHHIVLSDPATPPMCCACRTSQAMRQLLWHISWYTFFFWVTCNGFRCRRSDAYTVHTYH